MNEETTPPELASDTGDAPLTVSAIEYPEPVGKIFRLDSQHNLVKERPHRPPKAKAIYREFDTFEDFVDWRRGLTANVMLVAGTFESPEIDRAPVHYSEHARRRPGNVAATKDYLAFHQRPGVLILDHDVKDLAEVAGLYPEAPKRVSVDSFGGALDKVLPEAAGCALLVGHSTSAMISDADGNPLKGPGGVRAYLPVTDASQMPRILEIIHKRSIIHGYCWGFVDAGGGFQERGLVDLALGRPTQPDYAAPDLNDGLQQDRGWEIYDGERLDPNTVPDLSPQEEATYQAAVKKTKTALADALKRQKAVAKKRKAEKLVSQGVELKRARKIADRLFDHGVLTGADDIVFDDGDALTVAVLVSDGERYDGRLCRDPVEPDYDGGRPVGKFYWNDGMRPLIHSFAHGGRVCHLRHDLDSLRAVIDTGDRYTIVEAMARAEMSGLESEEAEAAAASALGLGTRRRELRRAVEAERERIREYDRDAGGEEAGDGEANRVGDRLVLNPSAPLVSARSFVESNYTLNGRQTLHHHGGDFYSWSGSHYPPVDKNTIRADIYNFLDGASREDAKAGHQVPFDPDAAKVSNVVDALHAAVNLDQTMRSPVWLNGAEGPPPSELVACANGLLHIRKRDLIPATPDFFSHNALDYAYSLDAGRPTMWLDFLDTLWGDDPESVETLQEIFGYAVTQDTRQQKLFLIVGPKRSGKGTIARLLTAMVGPDNVCNPTLASLSTNFGLQALINKQLAIISDARLGSNANQSQIAERLLSISGEDGQTIDRKYKNPWDGRLSTRFLILTNELPRLADASGALASRFIVLRMTENFYGREDLGLTNRLLTELPSILNWALDGWDRLRERGYFIQPKSAGDDIQALEDLASPIGAFIRDRCEVDPNCEVSVDSLYLAWRSWCEGEGRRYPGTKQTFGRDLKAAAPQIRVAMPRRRGGKRLRVYQGIGVAGADAARVARDGTRSTNCR